MTWEEQQVLDFLSSQPGTFFSRREIGRKAVKRAFSEENPNWINPVLEGLLNKGDVIQDAAGYYGLNQDKKY
jgi:hypothetical protein